MKLVETKLVTGHVEVMTGLHIGAGKDAIEIGGVDSPVVKNPYTKEPYIPGSSLKGKLRCLMEWATNRVETTGDVWQGGGERDPEVLAADPVLRIFGTTLKDWTAGPTRLIVRDCPFNSAWRDRLVEMGLPFTEEKFENNINRIQGKAGVGIRKTERVPAGSQFDLAILYRVFDTGDEGRMDQEYFDYLLGTMRLLEHDCLGGSGSRGYGRIRFRGLRLNGEDLQDRFESLSPEKILHIRRSA